MLLGSAHGRHFRRKNKWRTGVSSEIHHVMGRMWSKEKNAQFLSILITSVVTVADHLTPPRKKPGNAVTDHV